MTTKTKDQVYDELINPLVVEIWKVCKAHNIAWLAHFDISSAADPILRCTTATAGGAASYPPEMAAALRFLAGAAIRAAASAAGEPA